MKLTTQKILLKGFRLTALTAALGFSAIVYADAPVMDATPANAANGAQPAIAQPAQSGAANTSNANVANNNGTNTNSVPAATTTTSNSTANDNSSDSSSSMTTEQRLSHLEQQMANLNKINVAQQMSQLQDQMQSLSGQVQVEMRQLDQLNKQQRDFYQEVDSRITQLNTLVNNMNTTNATTSNTGPVTGTGKPVATTAPASATPAATATPAAATPTTASQKELDAYQQAFSLVLSKNLPDAEKALFTYLKNYPNGRYVPNGHYWLGEISLQDKDYKTAQKQFSIVVNQFPKNQKVADARLKLATILDDLGKKPAAKTAFESIVKDYPGSPSAQLAQVQLKQLG